MFCDCIHSPLGAITIYANTTHIIKLEYAKSKKNKPNQLTAKCKQQLQEYFLGTRADFTLPLAQTATEFQNKVWQATSVIPYGKTVNYQTIAENIDSPKSARAVGNALNKNPFLIIIPCHRIVAKTGNKLNYAGGEKRKEWLLLFESDP